MMGNPVQPEWFRRTAILAAMMGVVIFGLGRGRSMAAAPPADTGRPTDEVSERLEQAKKLIDRAGVRRGVCAVVVGGETLPLELAKVSELLIHVRVPDAAAAAQMQATADEAGFGIDRVAVEQGPIDKLPYADNMIDVVIAAGLRGKGALAAISPAEILRVLRPEGTAIVGAATAAEGPGIGCERLKDWACAGGAARTVTWADSFGSWVQFSKPALEGVDDWSHWEHGPDNNPVSTDQVIKAPYLTQFLAGPMYISMPAITTVAGGRTFLAVGHIAHHRREWDMINKLIARNGYNGTLLWQRDLPEGYMVHRSAFIATKDTFHMIDGDRCLLLDPKTGKEKGEIRVPDVEGDWKWMAMADGVLYVLAGKKEAGTQTMLGDRTFGGWSWADLSRGYYQKPRVPWGFGSTVAAYDLTQRRLLWKHREGESSIDSRGTAICQGKLFLYCPELHLRCLDLTTGDVVWTNADPEVLCLIEEPGRGLTSTPGFRSVSMAVATPKALVIQGQTRMNVVAVSTGDGSLLWSKKKVTNNPNVIFVDGKLVLGVGPGGSHVVVDPVSGEVLENLQFRKVSCTRLTACPDSFFCRGEGTLRFDRRSKKVLIDGAVRPACNDGAIPAGGMLYIGPWQCDCNLSLIGACGKCSAGDFRFDYVATEAERLQRGEGDTDEVTPLPTSENDWPTYRGNNRRTAGTTARLARPKAPAAGRISRRWEYIAKRPYVPSAPTSAGGLVFVSGSDGVVRALDAGSGAIRWGFGTPSALKMPPTICDGRAYFGGGDGYVYALEAATGRLLWRFRAAPVERHIMVYGHLSSTWPVNTGVLVEDGVAYFAAGITDQDGTYVYALDAKTGKIKWQNNSCGHLNPELRKGVSALGNLAIQGDRLLLAGGNQVSPAAFDLETGECLAATFDQGQPKANAGRFVGVLDDQHAVVGGRVLYSAPRNVATKGSFQVTTKRRPLVLNYGGVPPAWNGATLVLANFRHGKLTCCDAKGAAARIEKGFPPPTTQRPQRWISLADVFEADGAVRWQSDLGEPNKFETLSLAVCPNSVVAVVQYQHRIRSQPQWFVAAFNAENGTPYRFWRQELPSEPLPGGLLVDKDGQVVVTMLNGNVICLGLARGPRVSR